MSWILAEYLLQEYYGISIVTARFLIETITSKMSKTLRQYCCEDVHSMLCVCVQFDSPIFQGRMPFNLRSKCEWPPTSSAGMTNSMLITRSTSLRITRPNVAAPSMRSLPLAGCLCRCCGDTTHTVCQCANETQTCFVCVCVCPCVCLCLCTLRSKQQAAGSECLHNQSIRN